MPIHEDESSPRRVWWIAAASTLAIALVAGGWFLFGVSRPPRLKPEEAQSMATAFLEEVREGRVDEAWTATAADFKSAFGQERFRQLVRTTPGLRALADCQGCTIQRDQDPPMAECVFQPGVGKQRIRVMLSTESGQWKVGGLFVE